MTITRRTSFIAPAALLAGAALSFPRAAFAANSNNRFVFVILRGGLDGLSAAPPIGDTNYERARKGLALEAPLKLDTTFALHPNLKNLHAMAQAKELTLIHAVATPYRERSHFDAQNVLETGAGSPFARTYGWLNAALKSLPAQNRKELGLALSGQAPLVLRGDAAVATWSPSILPSADGDTVARLMALYRKTDAQLANALQAAAATNGVAAESGAMNAMSGARGQPQQQVAVLARAAAGFLKQPDGPVAAVIEIGGWDTHTGQGLAQGALARNLTALDEGMAALKKDLGPLWANTAVVIATEFGRTVAMNGGGGTDHGTAAAAFLLGGAVKGRVIADWPGLSTAQLYEARDLKPTTDIRAVLKGVLRDHLGVAQAALNNTVFPGSAAVKPMDGLLRA